MYLSVLNRAIRGFRKEGTSMTSGGSQKGTALTIIVIEGPVGIAALIARPLLRLTSALRKDWRAG